MPPPVAIGQITVPLCVDLDGTVIKTDLVWESLLRLLRRSPFYVLLVPFWLLKGRAYLKARIADRSDIDPTTIPYNEEFIDFLRQEKNAGHRLLLVTASDQRLADKVGVHLGLFDEVLGSDGRVNLRGGNKGEVLAEKFGEKGFDYAGNSSVDLPVWTRARRALIVNASPALPDKARRTAEVGPVFRSRPSFWSAFLAALRPHHWPKNLIVFVPLITAHRVHEMPLLLEALLAFVAFCLVASGVYLLNDLLDLEADRHHATKKTRGLASGDLPIWCGLAGFPALMLAGGLLAWNLSAGFLAVLGFYVLLTTAYSWRLKQAPLVDVFCLAGLYTVRLIGGHEATHVAYSFWLLVFSMFVFLSLALVKRYVEIDVAREERRDGIKGRGYSAGDLGLVSILGATSGYLAVLVLALYVNSNDVVVLYEHPTALLLICPLLLYWVSRTWMLAHRGKMQDDPIVFTLKDPGSYAVGLLTLLIIWLATGK